MFQKLDQGCCEDITTERVIKISVCDGQNFYIVWAFPSTLEGLLINTVNQAVEKYEPDASVVSGSDSDILCLMSCFFTEQYFGNWSCFRHQV